MPYPPFVPYLEAENICKVKLYDGDDQACAQQWLSRLFEFGSPAYKKAYWTLVGLLEDDDSFYPPADVGEMSALMCWNDQDHVKRSYIASKLNECFRRLGYDLYFFPSQEETSDLIRSWQ
jgi:hypothetical protein